MTLPHRALSADARHLAHERDRLRLLCRVRWEEVEAALGRFLATQRELRALDGEAEDAQEFVAFVQAAERWTPAKGTRG